MLHLLLKKTYGIFWNVIFCILALIPNLLLAQNLRGIVKLQSSNNKALVGVQIISSDADFPSSTLSDGSFTLSFSKKHVGEFIKVQASLPGYEVVNKSDLDCAIPWDENHQLVITMNFAGEMERATAKYYGIGLPSIEKSYGDKIERLTHAAVVDRDSIIYYKTELSKAKVQLSGVASLFAATDFDNCSNLVKEAFEAFQRNNLAKAIEILNPADLNKELADARQEKRQGKIFDSLSKAKNASADRKIANVIDGYINRARFLFVAGKFSAADESYYAAYLADTSKFKTVQEYAGFLYHQNFYSKALLYYIKSLAIAQSSKDSADILNNIAVMYKSTGNSKLAEEAFMQSISIQFASLQKFDTVAKINVLNTQNNLADFYIEEGKFSNARDILNEIETDSNLLRASPFYRAQVYNNWGFLYSKMRQYDKATPYFKWSLDIFRRLGKEKGTEDYQLEYLKVAINLAMNYLDRDSLLESDNIFRQAIPLMEEFNHENPSLFRPYLIPLYSNCGILLERTGEYANSILQYKKAASAILNSDFTDSIIRAPDLALIYSNMSVDYMRMGDFVSADSLLKSSLKIRERLYSENNNKYGSQFGHTLLVFGELYFRWKKFEASKKYYLKARDIYEKLDKNIYADELARIDEM